MEALKEQLINDPQTIDEIKNKIVALNDLNIATQAKASSKLLGENILLEKVINAGGEVIYKQYKKIQVLENKLVEVGEYDEEGLNRLLEKQIQQEQNIQKYNKIKELILAELEQSKQLLGK
jgi:hypothetical protein